MPSSPTCHVIKYLNIFLLFCFHRSWYSSKMPFLFPSLSIIWLEIFGYGAILETLYLPSISCLVLRVECYLLKLLWKLVSILPVPPTVVGCSFNVCLYSNITILFDSDCYIDRVFTLLSLLISRLFGPEFTPFTDVLDYLFLNSVIFTIDLLTMFYKLYSGNLLFKILFAEYQ